MHLHRGPLFWGLALVVGGATALAVQQGYLDKDLVASAWRLWPLILVGIGLSMILSRTLMAPLGIIVAAVVVGFAGGALISVGPVVAGCTGNESGDRQEQQGTFGATATVNLSFNCGTLEVRSVPGHQWTLSSGQTNGGGASITSSDSSLVATSDANRNWWEGGRQRWVVRLPQATQTALEIQPNAADSTISLTGGRFDRLLLQPNAGSVHLDLRGARVDLLDLTLNAGSASIQLDSEAAMSGTLSVNAGSIELCVEPGTALRLVMAASVAFSHNLDGSNLVRSGDTWSTPGYTGATDQVELRVAGNAASFTLNPEGGCS